MVRSVSWLYARLPAGLPRALLPALLTVAATGSGLVLLHILVGTANIPFTVTPPLSVAFLFCLLTTYKLAAGKQRQQPP